MAGRNGGGVSSLFNSECGKEAFGIFFFRGVGRLQTHGENLSSYNNVKPHEKTQKGVTANCFSSLHGAAGGTRRSLAPPPAPCDDVHS